MTTRWDVERAVTRSKIPPLARLVVLVLAMKADNKTGIVPDEHTPTLATLSDLTGISKASLAEWLKALETAGWVVRDRDTPKGPKTRKTSYALAVGTDDVALADRSARTPRPRKSVEEVADESVGEALVTAEVGPRGGPELVREADRFGGLVGPRGGPELVREADRVGPRGGHSLTTPLPTGEGTTENHHGARGANESSNTPAPSVPKWSANDRKPTTPTAVYGKTAALFPKPRPVAVETLMEAHQVIYRWLQANGYQSLGVDEVRQIHLQLVNAHGTKLNPGYLRTVVANGGALPYAEAIKKERHEKIAAVIVEMRRELPQCPHGAPAGEYPHPTTGVLLCAQCRRGLPAAANPDQTDPAVQAALTAYRSKRGNDILINEILETTQQIEAFRAEGATAEQLVAIAEIAGSKRISLIKAAGVAA